MAQSHIRILVVDDHAVVRTGLAATLDPETDMEVVASTPSGKDALVLFREKRPDVTIMDLALTPEMDGIQAIYAIRQEFPDARIVVLSVYGGDEDISRALQAGAITFLLKETLGTDLVSIIRDVHAGGRPIPDYVARKLADRASQRTLTPRELEVLSFMAKGMRNKEIGTALFVTEATVHVHVKNIFSKLKVHDRTEASMLAIRRGIIRLD